MMQPDGLCSALWAVWSLVLCAHPAEATSLTNCPGNRASGAEARLMRTLVLFCGRRGIWLSEALVIGCPASRSMVATSPIASCGCLSTVAKTGDTGDCTSLSMSALICVPLGISRRVRRT